MHLPATLTLQLLAGLAVRLFSAVRHPLVVMTPWLRQAWVLTA
jgi:hypothetical protein